jgi:medium-chain acyl-[acyl-carrier-protein] hydrolase
LRDRPLIRIEDVVQDAAAAIHAYLDIPFAFFGHSMGALICFELARHLRSEYGVAPVHLFISARRAPQFPDRRPLLRPLRDDQFVAEMRRRYNGIPREVLADAELMKLLLQVLRADVEMLETYVYVPGAPLECPITAFGGREDTEAGIVELEGWREHTNGRFKTKLFPGNHFFVQSAQREVLETISHNLSLEKL